MFKLNTDTHLTPEFKRSIESGYANIPVAVTGYWSGESITIRVNRDFYGETRWNVEVSHSSGGRDPKAVEDSCVAEYNFGSALIAAAAYGGELKGMKDYFEEIYQAEAKVRKEEAAKIAAERQKAIDADPELGELAAKKLVKSLAAYPMHDGNARAVKVKTRGKDEFQYLFVSESRSGQTHYMITNNPDAVGCSFKSNRLTFGETIKALAKSSNKTV